MWRKRQTRVKLAPNVHHNEQNPSDLVNILTNSSIKSEQKHDILTYPLDILHEENVRLGLYEGVYDLSIKSDNLSIKSEDLSIKSWVGLTDEEIGMAFRAVFPVGGVVFTNGATEFAQTIERKLKEKNT
jgi:hypothetical protein